MPEERLLKKLDDSINLYNSHFTALVSDAKNSNFPYTLKALISGLEKIEQLRITVFSDDISFYSAQVLERVILEHHIIHVYMAFQSFFTETDSVGERYYNDYARAEELIREINKCKVSLPDLPQGTPRYEIYKKVKPNDLISKELFKSYMKVFDQFSLSKMIIPKLLEYRGKSELLDTYLGNFPLMLRLYSDLCSYVHGGPIAEMEFKTFGGEKQLKRIDTSRIWAIHSTRGTIQYIFLLLFRSGNKNYLDLLKNIT